MCDKKKNDILGMGPRILIVEDNQRLARLERERLAERMPGCEIRLAFEGTVARAMLQQYQWDLVLLDLAIPPPDGMSLLRWMSRQPTMPPVIVASGCSDEKIQQQALQLGAKYFMIKPYHLDDMADNVRMLLSVRETDDGAADPEKQAYLQRARAYLLRMTDHLEAEGFRYVLMGVENYYDMGRAGISIKALSAKAGSPIRNGAGNNPVEAAIYRLIYQIWQDDSPAYRHLCTVCGAVPGQKLPVRRFLTALGEAAREESGQLQGEDSACATNVNGKTSSG